MDVTYINPFIEAAVGVLKSVCSIEAKIGKLSTKKIEFDGSTKVILIGITGTVKGQVFIAFNKIIANKVVSAMMGMVVETLDEIGDSALAELGNIIMGNTATILSKREIKIDITPPTLARGKMEFNIKGMKHVCIPLVVGDTEIEMYVAIR